MIKQRSDLTFKHNVGNGRHGWLRLTPAYSLKLVDAILGRASGSLRVLDPFCGTGTTPLAAASLGHEAVSTDINPFLIWFAKAKTARFQRNTLETVAEIAPGIGGPGATPVDAPNLHNIERWWDPDALGFLRTAKAQIDTDTRPRSAVRDLLYIAFCRTLIEISNAAFNHQSMSFKARGQSSDQLKLFEDAPSPSERFQANVERVLHGASVNPKGKATILECDARELDLLDDDSFDLLVTSPPYPNRMSYIRELRPYMFWLGFLQHAREAGELDWKAIGGTWGTATSLLASWERSEDAYIPAYLDKAINQVAEADSKHAVTLSSYIAKYFVDLWTHLRRAHDVMKSGGEVHYIVGNSTFYGVLIPVERVYADMLREVGFESVGIETIRKRNSKKALFEFDVYARKP